MNLFLILIGSFWFRYSLGNSLFNLLPPKPDVEDRFVKLDMEEKTVPKREILSQSDKTGETNSAPKGRTTASVDTPKKARSRVMDWDKSRQLTWVELKPELGVMYAQKHKDGPFCKLGDQGPECSEEYFDGNSTEDSGESGRNITERARYDGLGYERDCRTDELNQLRAKVEAPVISETTKRIVVDQNIFLSRVFIARALGRYNATVEQEPKHGFALFDKMMSMVNNACPADTVPKTFLDSLSFFLKELHASVSPKRTEYLSDFDFTWIDRILTTCQNRTLRNLKALTDLACGSKLTPINDVSKYICNGPPLNVDFHFHEKVYDPGMDAIWHIFTAISYLCFEDFVSESSRMYHHFTAAIIDLFTAPMKLKWTNQIEGNYKTVFQRLLGPFYQVYMENIERCILFLRDVDFAETPQFDFALPRFYSYGSVRY